jgi:hypothetical protein
LIHMGEAILSLRTLMRRTVTHRVWGHREGAAKDVRFNISNNSRLPLYPGFDPNGIHTAQEIIGAGSAPYNFVHWVPLTWFSQCFVGNKGSVIWHINVDSTVRSGNTTLQRRVATRSAASADAFVSANGTLNDSVLGNFFVTNEQSMFGGATVTNQESQAGVSALAPMYNKNKFMMNNPNTRTLGSSTDDSDYDTIITTSTFYNTTVGTFFSKHYYVCAGTDYTPVFFLNVPGLYRQGSVPAATP